MQYKLLAEFRKIFEGTKYKHRVSTHGDKVAVYLYEDLTSLNRSPKFAAAVSSRTRVINTKNLAVGKRTRRGDGTFGERLPHQQPAAVPGLAVAFGEVATIEIGVEVKVLAKAMRKQLDRVCSDLVKQVNEFKRLGGSPICVGVVGVNWATKYTSYEGKRAWPTDGRKYPHPSQEAAAAEQDLISRVGMHFDELVLLRFVANNTKPFAFSWVNQAQTEREYGAALVRISRTYETRF